MRFRINKKGNLAASICTVGAAILFSLSFQAFAKEIVFILGSDLPGETVYYGPAIEYYQKKNETTPLVLVSTARSLAEVREVLQRSDNDGPWERVTLVSHGTPWRGMLTNIYADGVSATLENIENAASSGEFPPLPESKIDSRTIIRLESCGIGRRPDYLKAMAKLFAPNKDQMPGIEASEDFIAFVVRNDSDGTKVTRRLELPVVIKTAPGDLKSIGDAYIEEQLEGLGARLDRKLKGSAADAIWAVSPINISVKVMPPQTRNRSAVQIAEKNEFVGNVARIHGIRIADLKWELGNQFDSGGMQELKGAGVFILMRANVNNVNELDLKMSEVSE